MKEMFSRSEEKFNVKYTNYIGDGDSKTFKALLDLQPYGEDVVFKKVNVCRTRGEENRYSIEKY